MDGVIYGHPRLEFPPSGRWYGWVPPVMLPRAEGMTDPLEDSGHGLASMLSSREETVAAMKQSFSTRNHNTNIWRRRAKSKYPL